MAPSEQSLQAERALRIYIFALFNDARVLDPRDWKIFAGISRYFNAPEIPIEIRDTTRAEALNIKTRYAILLPKKPVRVSVEGGDFFSFDLPRAFHDLKDRRTTRMVYAYHLQRRADLVWDDADELLASDFPYPEVDRLLTAAVRKKVYGRTLGDVLPPADNAAESGFFDSGWAFRTAAATSATYDVTVPGKPYYPKYRSNDGNDRRFDFDHLSDDYLRLNFRPFDLQREVVHLFLTLGSIEILIALHLDDKGQLHYEALSGNRLPMYGNYFSIIQEHLRLLNASGRKPHAEAWFVYPVEGPTTAPAWTTGRMEVAQGFGIHVLEQVIDPRCMVQSTRGLDCRQLDPAQAKWTNRRWVRELVRLRFADPWVWFWKNAHVEMPYALDREMLFLKELRDAEKKADGPLKQRLREFITTAANDPTLYLIRRGREYGADRRLVGSDESYVYIYDNSRQILTRLPMFAFWIDMNIAQISSVIYNSTRGIVPIAKALAFGGLIVAGWAIIGTEVLVAGFRQYVSGRIRGAVIDQLLKVQFEKLRDRVLLMLVNGLLSFFPVTSASSRPYAFVKGFLQGYTHDAFVALFHRWDSFVRQLEPAAYHAVKLLMQIEAALLFVDEKLSQLKGAVGARVAGLLLDRFVKVFVDAGSALAALVNSLYFLDFERIKPILQAYAELTKEKMPTKAEWDRMRHRHFLETFRQYRNAIRTEQMNVKDVYQDVQHKIEVLQRAVRVAGALLMIEIASGGGLVSMVWFALVLATKVIWSTPGKIIAGNLAGGLALATAVSDDFRKLVKEAIVDLAELTRVPKIVSFAFGTPERMERFGQLLGVLIGGMTLNKHVFGDEKGWLERWSTEKSYGSFVTNHFVRSQLSVSPLVPIVKLALFNYVFLIEKVIAETKKSWGDLEDQIHTILVGDQQDQDTFGPNQELTLAKIADIIVAVDGVLKPWLVQLSEIPGLTEQIDALVDTIASTPAHEVPTFEKLRDDDLPEGWSREAVMFVVLSHVHAALLSLADAIREMFTPVDDNAAVPFSLADFLKVLGFQLNEDEVVMLLDRDFDAVFPDAAPAAPAAAP